MQAEDWEEFLEKPLFRFRIERESDEDPLLGANLGSYRIQERVRGGGMGVVYKACRADGRFVGTVAIKVVKRGMDSEEILRRFRNEQQTLAQLNHPGIAKLIDAGLTDDGRPYLVMEFIDGKPLDERCRREDLSLDQRLDLFQQVCDAVDHAHRNLVLHRDLKPSNILVQRDGRVKLLDFGVAQFLDPLLSGATRVHTTGADRYLTPEYASPEQLRGFPLSTASDVYGLGLVLFEILTGRRPFPPMPAERGLPSFSKAEEKSIPKDLRNVVRMALREEIDGRYLSVHDLSQDLGRFRGGYPVTACGDSLTYRFRRFLRRRRWSIAAGVLALALIGAGAGVAFREALQREQEEARHRILARDLLEQVAARREDPAALGSLSKSLERILNNFQVRATPLSESRLPLILLAPLMIEYASIQFDPDRPSLGNSPMAVAIYLKTLRLLESNLEKGLHHPQIRQHLAWAHFNLGRIYAVAKAFEPALAHLEKAKRDLGAKKFSFVDQHIELVLQAQKDAAAGVSHP